jgi:hypothetical protein
LLAVDAVPLTAMSAQLGDPAGFGHQNIWNPHAFFGQELPTNIGTSGQIAEL